MTRALTPVTVPDERWLDLWPAGTRPALDLAVWDLTGPPPAGHAEGPRLVVLPYLGGTRGLDRLAGLPALQVVQTLTAGYDNVLPYLPDGVALHTAAGVHDASTAELAVGLTIAALRGLDEFARAAGTGTWLYGSRTSLADRRVLLVGTGGVGRAIAARLAPFEVTVTRVGTRARDEESGPVHAVDELPDLLPLHDVVILAVPLDERTRGMAGTSFLAAMPDGALLVNVARGPVVDTDALLAELVRGRLHAALDVTDPEPLPPGHPLWQAPNVLISPHVGGNTTAFAPRARALLRDQLERFADGRPLRNRVLPAG
ncbi:MAG TPA: 2-hydroxyacid dehydrogenase [Kineosporiaceae bacterium]|nr:2-hydroxyacid dehydrogenase [Kineosporiaceae bacterium]